MRGEQVTAKRKSSKQFDNRLLDGIGVPIVNLATDSRLIKPGDTFLAYAGETADGRDFIPQAIAAGANAVLWDPKNFTWDPQWRIPELAIDELKARAGLIASHVYGDPSRKLSIVAITGTNGKTSCSHWYAQAMRSLSEKTAIIGTLGSGFCGALEGTANTTPDATVLQRSLAEFAEQGAEQVVMEVSSHGLAQGRINGTALSIAVLTNLSRDHLDYHRDMDSYAATKASLFFWPGLKYAIVNMDDVLGVELSRQLANQPVETIGYGFHYPGERYPGRVKIVHGSNLRFDIHGMAFDIEFEDDRAHLEIGLLGKFNASNLLAVTAAMLASGIRLPDAVRSLRHVQPIPGRMEKYERVGQPIVIVDYAHTPDALEKVLCSLRELSRATEPRKATGRNARRLYCVVGCGGDRDRGKRSLVGEVAARLADTTIFTSDNPRSEDPLRIIRDIAAGAKTANFQIEADRSLAIYQAIANAAPGDIVLIAGKGHERFQEIKGQKIPFSDADVVQQVFSDLTAKGRVTS
ncbi:MAG: UDP-N-acetylmuramoyl-L-alanyl-D-glutamate--2,6-diaminopimelate ligase [Nitrosomonas sp.]|nr:MAG: UDP-N-acetylmuramoyl-L-alanyl-D-glutamate--2,6-diaminopimelate ligase [Nitrosomonas sp.]